MRDARVVVIPGASAGVPGGDDVADDEVAQQAEHVQQHVEVADGPPGEGVAGVGEDGGVGEGEGGSRVAAAQGEGGASGELKELRGRRTLPLQRTLAPAAAGEWSCALACLHAALCMVRVLHGCVPNAGLMGSMATV